MKNSLKTFKIHFANEVIEMPLGYWPLETTIAEGKAVLKNFPNGCLLERKHPFLQTQFDMTDSSSCWLLVFDDQLQFVTAKPFVDCKANMSFFIADPYVVLIPFDNSLALDRIESLEIILN